MTLVTGEWLDRMLTPPLGSHNGNRNKVQNHTGALEPVFQEQVFICINIHLAV